MSDVPRTRGGVIHVIGVVGKLSRVRNLGNRRTGDTVRTAHPTNDPALAGSMGIDVLF